MIIRAFFICALFIRVSTGGGMPKDLQETLQKISDEKPDPQVIKYTFTLNNETNEEVMEPEAQTFTIIPVNYVCEFCQVLIIQLKERQSKEKDFEAVIKKECEENKQRKEKDCELINKMNLDRLKKEEPRSICEDSGLCAKGSAVSQKSQEIADEVHEESGNGTVITKEAVADNQNVNLTMHVEDPDTKEAPVAAYS